MTRVGRGLMAAIRARPGVFCSVAALILLLDILVPPAVLSIARKPMDYVAVNPWLKRLPEFVMSSEVPISRKIEFLPRLALFWFVADGSIAPEWGFAVTVTDLARFLLMGLLFGAYFALWAHRRGLAAVTGRGASRTHRGGVVGALLSTVGLSTGPCTVTGCGAPVLPVVGLAVAGLSSTTIRWLSDASAVAAWLLLGGVTLAVVYLAWVVGGLPPRDDQGRARVARDERAQSG